MIKLSVISELQPENSRHQNSTLGNSILLLSIVIDRLLVSPWGETRRTAKLVIVSVIKARIFFVAITCVLSCLLVFLLWKIFGSRKIIIIIYSHFLVKLGSCNILSQIWFFIVGCAGAGVALLSIILPVLELKHLRDILWLNLVWFFRRFFWYTVNGRISNHD